MRFETQNLCEITLAPSKVSGAIGAAITPPELNGMVGLTTFTLSPPTSRHELGPQIALKVYCTRRPCAPLNTTVDIYDGPTRNANSPLIQSIPYTIRATC